jgi:hypothetical protein
MDFMTKQKRWRAPKAKPGELKIAYGKERGDDPTLFFCYGAEGASKRDSNFLMWLFSRELEPGVSVTKELESRGYDITTLKFSIMQKQCGATKGKK